MRTHIPLILLNALPASGKSEVITFLKDLPDDVRLRDYHLGKFAAIDDFPDLHTMQTIDDARQKLGMARVHFEPQGTGGNLVDDRVWLMLIELLNTHYRTLLAKNPRLFDTHTLLVEFARGDKKEQALPLPYGYERCYAGLDRDILGRASVLYIKVSPSESRRRNIRRADPNDPGSLLKHGVPETQMNRWYGRDDMEPLLEKGPAGCVRVGEFTLPVGVFDNEEEKTAFVHDAKPWKDADADRLGGALRGTLDGIWKRLGSR